MSTQKNAKSEQIGQRIRQFRKQNNLTLVQLSEIIGISHGSLSGLENGKSKPSAETLSNFCLYTEIDIKWLLTGEKAKEEKKESPINRERKKIEILNQAEEWLEEIVEKNPKREIWFEVEFEKTFQEFKKWKEEKETETIEKDYTSNRKVA
nr:helix-turn-helix transcriptional regulator [uncultured Desulfobulbus sp.]